MKLNNRKGLKDIWNAGLVEGADWYSNDIPCCSSLSSEVPKSVIRWSDTECTDASDSWICFYEDRACYDGPDGIWAHPDRLLSRAKRYGGVIVPDFSRKGEAPEAVRLWDIYRSHVLAYWLAQNGIPVIKSCWYDDRWGFDDFSSLAQRATVSVDTRNLDMNSCQDRGDIECTIERLRELVKPSSVVVYGTLYEGFSRLVSDGVSVYHADPSSGEVNVWRPEEMQRSRSNIDYDAPLIAGESVAGIKLGTHYEELKEVVNSSDSELMRYETDHYCYLIGGCIELWFARCNDRLFQIAVNKDFKGKVWEYDNIWELDEDRFLKEHGSEFEWLDWDEMYESLTLGLDIAFSSVTGLVDTVCIRVEETMGDGPGNELYDWTITEEERETRRKESLPHDFFTENAEWDDLLPVCPTTSDTIPSRIIPWSVARYSDDHDAFVSFYEDDWKFDGKNGIWNAPESALEILSKFKGVVSPDYSTYADFPLPIKIYNTYRMRAFGYWLTTKGLKVINNVRWGDPETWWWCFLGIETESVVCIGTVGGSPYSLENRSRFVKGLDALVEELKPETIITYGSSSYPCFDKLREQGIRIVECKGQTALAFEKKSHSK